MKKSAWLPAIIAPVVVAGAIAAPAIANAASDGAKAPSAASVLATVAKTDTLAYSGKLTQTSDLGLPELPSSAGGSGAGGSGAGGSGGSGGSGSGSLESGASDVLELLTASHSARIYVNGATKARVQVLDQLAERDVVLNGRTAWTWDSKENRATKILLPSGSGAAQSSVPTSGATTPADLAERAIAAITPTTKVGTPTSVTVAGQGAWQIVLTPKQSTTLVHHVTLAIDKKTGLPLSAAIEATGQSTSAVSVAYTSIDYGTPSASLFDFTPPSNATVTTEDLSDRTGADSGHHAGATPGSGDRADAPTTTGTGWSTIATFPAGSLAAGAASDSSTANAEGTTGADGTQLLDQLTRAVDGGRALQTSLVSVYLADDGRVLVGAVPVSDLVAAAKAPAADTTK